MPSTLPSETLSKGIGWLSRPFDENPLMNSPSCAIAACTVAKLKPCRLVRPSRSPPPAVHDVGSKMSGELKVTAALAFRPRDVANGPVTETGNFKDAVPVKVGPSGK